MRFARSFRSGLAGVLALLVLIALWIIVVVEKCERNVSGDETAGMAGQQIPFKE
jgi:uncharacterized membrane protein